MAKVRTLIALQQRLDAELAWRIQDITALKRAVSGANSLTKDTFIRASVTMLYAHWEGFIKSSACAYSDYLEGKGFKFKEIQPSFKGLKALEHVRTLSDIRRRIFTSSALLETLQRIEEERVALPLATYLDQIGNLNYSLFEQVAEFLALDAAQYATKKQLIDVSLLKRRNSIAHGDRPDDEIDEVELMKLSEEVVVLLRQFKTDVENSAALESYKRAA